MDGNHHHLTSANIISRFNLPIQNGDFPVRYVKLPEGTLSTFVHDKLRNPSWTVRTSSIMCLYIRLSEVVPNVERIIQTREGVTLIQSLF